MAKHGKKLPFHRVTKEDYIQNQIHRMDPQEYTIQLFLGYFTDTLESLRQQELNALLAIEPGNQAILSNLKDPEWLNRELQLLDELEAETDLTQILQVIMAIPKILTGDSLTQRETFKTTKTAILRDFIQAHWRVAILILFIGLGLIGLVNYLSLPGGKSNPEISRSSFSPAIRHAQLSFAGKTYPSDIIYRRGGLQEGNMDITSDGKTFIFKANGSDVAPSDFYEVVTPRGNSYSVRLPDSSTVKMNAAASIEIPSSYSINHRKVKLRGQGLFQVASAGGELQPFIVDVQPPDALKKYFQGLSGLKVMATDTTSDIKDSFDIKANQDDSSIIINLFAGSLKIVRSGDSTLSLAAGKVFVLDKQGKVIVLPMDQLPGATAWKDNEFLFNFEPADEILRELSRWYDARIRYEKKPSGIYRINGRRDEPVDSLLNRMKRAPFNFEYSLRNDTIIVSH